MDKSRNSFTRIHDKSRNSFARINSVHYLMD